VHRFGAYENLYTVGLRNIDDFSVVGAGTPRQMADILSDVIATQRKILSEELCLGRRPGSFSRRHFPQLPCFGSGLPSSATYISTSGGRGACES
jgi:hypothetical protein